jgi:hypothetical protein
MWEDRVSELANAIAKAIESAEVGYHLRLTSLVDGVSTYTLTYDDGSKQLEFDDINDGYAHIAQKKRLKAARAVVAAVKGYLADSGRDTGSAISVLTSALASDQRQGGG